jgi:hypothetical protein
MTVLTDDLIEKAARAIWEDKTGLLDWSHSCAQDIYRRSARACLTAVLPDVVEACAKVAEDNSTWGVGENGGEEWPSPYELAEAIRSLLEGK